MPKSTKTNVFVYGSLKHGFGNHWAMKEAGGELIGEFVSSSAHFVMFSLGRFPGIQLGAGGRVLGEVYSVPWDGVKETLDAFEGNGCLYKRHVYKFRPALSSHRKPIIKAWMYVSMNQRNTVSTRGNGYMVEKVTNQENGLVTQSWKHTLYDTSSVYYDFFDDYGEDEIDWACETT